MSIENYKLGILSGLEKLNTDKIKNNLAEDAELKISQPREIEQFDYSIIDNDTASFLHEKENRITQIKAMSTVSIGKELKEAQNKLANYDKGLFYQWFQSIGLKKDSVYRAIKVYDWVIANCDNLENLEVIQPSLLYEVSKPSAPLELQEAVITGDITTHKQYKKLEMKLKEFEEKTSEADFNYETIKSDYECKTLKLEKELEIAKRQIEDLKDVDGNDEIATAIVEKIPDEILEELSELRKRGDTIESGSDIKAIIKILNFSIISLSKAIMNNEENNLIYLDITPYVFQMKDNLQSLKNIALESFNKDLFDFIKD